MHGAISGTMSPIAPMGVVAAKIVQPMVGNISLRLFLDLFVANIVIAVLAYFFFGGLKLITRFRDNAVDFEAGMEQTEWKAKQIATVIGILCLVVATIIFKLHIGLTAITIGVILAWFDKSDDKKALKTVKWDTLLMVTGVMILIGLMSQTGGLKMIGQGVASFTTPDTAPAVLAFVAGLVSDLLQHHRCGPAGLPADDTDDVERGRRRGPAGFHQTSGVVGQCGGRQPHVYSGRLGLSIDAGLDR